MTQEIFRCIYGSRLFGTNIATSDTDWKAVHIPDAKDIVLGRANRGVEDRPGSRKQKNTSADEDFTTYPLNRYLELLGAMDTVAVEMLFAPNMHEVSPIWDRIYENRHRLMSGRPDKCIGYARAQVTRYVLRGERVQKLEDLVAVLSKVGRKKVVGDEAAMAALGAMEDVKLSVKTEQDGAEVAYMDAFGKEFQLTQFGSNIAKIYQKELDMYGHRSRQAQKEAGVDWKGMYHAVRILDQGLELMTTGELVFPLAHRERYLKIRNGELALEQVQDEFEERLEVLKSTPINPVFSGEADEGLIEEMVFDVYGEAVSKVIRERNLALRENRLGNENSFQ